MILNNILHLSLFDENNKQKCQANVKVKIHNIEIEI